ncbi:lipocalin family protein [Pseudogemmobacter humi]|uniref:Uncharacterized protein n=1 Tax=Pseudogemmobacter humi TaxID=2483812 RepID=A0A3P5X9K5_9RHOB|nr:lipocalin family protein [Pseudogemmobacter humi]VDC31178.1 hypothetical protein XINFAN_02777 [Pseudogemmobacter humi]
MPAMIRPLVLALLLAGCAAPEPVRIASFRPEGAPIWSAAAFAPARIEGEWRQVATFSAAEPGCRPGGAVFRREGEALTIQARLCLNGREVTASGPVTVSGPGRLTVPGMGEWWVIWVDSGYRTLAIATPRGDYGFVLDRGAISSDRLRAAAEIFDFNGYAKGNLRPF